MSDSPVESVWRDVFVDELPFSSKVDRAVQLQRYERKGGKHKSFSKTNMFLHSSGF